MHERVRYRYAEPGMPSAQPHEMIRRRPLVSPVGPHPQVPPPVSIMPATTAAASFRPPCRPAAARPTDELRPGRRRAPPAETRPTACSLRLPHPTPPRARHVLLVEDDDGDALLVRELLPTACPAPLSSGSRRWPRPWPGPTPPTACCSTWACPTPRHPRGRGAGRPGARTPPIVVLTGADSERLGVGSVMAGAQDYLVKGRVDDQLLARSVRYAIERQRAVRLTLDLFEAERRRAENTRVERALTPDAGHPLRRRGRHPALPGPARGLRPGRRLLRRLRDRPTAPSTCSSGDVAGHGPDEAALAARLRGAWRALVLAGLGRPRGHRHARQLHPHRVGHDHLRHRLHADRSRPTGASAAWCWPGTRRPSSSATAAAPSAASHHGSLLGVLPEPRWQAVPVPLDPGATLLLYTDGLIEGWSCARRHHPPRRRRPAADHRRLPPGGDHARRAARRAAGRGAAPQRRPADGRHRHVPRPCRRPWRLSAARCGGRRGGGWSLRARLALRCWALVAAFLLVTLFLQLTFQNRLADERDDLINRVDGAAEAVGDLRIVGRPAADGRARLRAQRGRRGLPRALRAGPRGHRRRPRPARAAARRRRVDARPSSTRAIEAVESWQSDVLEPGIDRVEAGVEPDPERMTNNAVVLRRHAGDHRRPRPGGRGRAPGRPRPARRRLLLGADA